MFTTQSAGHLRRVRPGADLATDADGQSTTTTAYTPATGAEPTSETVTDPMGLVTTTTYDPARDLPLTVTNPAGWVTTETYDALGRLTAVWTPGHATERPGGQDVQLQLVSDTAPSVVTTSTINDHRAATCRRRRCTTRSAARSRPRPRPPDGGRDITDTYYNSDGWQLDRLQLLLQPPARPSTTLVAAPDDEVPSQTGLRLRRRRPGDPADLLQPRHRDMGDRHQPTAATTPPSPRRPAAPPQTTYANGDRQDQLHLPVPRRHPAIRPARAGHRIAVRHHGWDETGYAYTPAGQLATDHRRGRQPVVLRLRPDRRPDLGRPTRTPGTAASTYDGDGNLLSVTNAGTKTTISYAYDAGQPQDRRVRHHRRRGARPAPTSSRPGPTTPSPPGSSPTAVAYVGGTSGTKYTESVAGYNTYGLPTGTTTTVSAGTWAGTYKELLSYSSYADEETEAYASPAAGGLPSEDGRHRLRRRRRAQSA